MQSENELAWSSVALAATVTVLLASTLYYGDFLITGSSRIPRTELVALLMMVPLVYGNLVYQLSRIGALRREDAHRPASRGEIERIYERPAPALTILIPSYREEPHVLRQTVLSAALVECPGRRVVVLIDDPPEDSASRAASWGVISDAVQLLAVPAHKFALELADFRARSAAGACKPETERHRIVALYENLADWFDLQATECEDNLSSQFAHADMFFAETMFRARAREHRRRADAIRRQPVDAARIEREYIRLSELLKADISGFERKKYANLSHAPNKAMNLNSYIGLMGRHLHRVRGKDGIVLSECAPAEAEIHIPSADFVLTLDADSMILPDYALRLLRAMQADDRIAVAQTPYSAFPGAPSPLERAAGATTDIQFTSHQGSSYFDAAYWVGANALLRVAALHDIRSESVERGYTVPVFIQDRTVIEDTGSTVDLIQRGWTIYNYPERLAYSATPPDFGALIIQRRRWSNGGLLILPDLLRFSLRRGKSWTGLAQALMRIHYLVSPAIGSIAVLTLLLYPFEPMLSGFWLTLVAGPYYLVYGRELVRSGYDWADLARVYALTLLLVPVNLAGVLLSLRQAATGRKASFGRTPKVEDRTAVPPFYFGFNCLMFAIMIASAAYAVAAGRYGRVFFPAFNGLVYAYGLWRMIGWRDGLVDAVTGLRHGLATDWRSRLRDRTTADSVLERVRE